MALALSRKKIDVRDVGQSESELRTEPAASLEPIYAIEGVPINLATSTDALNEVTLRTRFGLGFTLFTLNLDHLVKVRSRGDFLTVYQRASLITADGWPIVWLANHAGRPIERICGADLVEPICGLAASEGFPVFFIGPGHSSQKTAISRLLSRFPKLKVVGAQSPNLPVSPEPERVAMLAEAITASQASICFISLGAPKQEFLADALSALCPHVGFLCVGAALDFISGHELRAPHWLQLARLEWLWRLCGDPRRLAGRYLLSAFELLVQIWKLIFPRRNSRKLKKIETL